MPSKSQLTYPVIGAIFGAGALLGSFLFRFLAFPDVRKRPFDELRKNGSFYLYDVVATSLVFAIGGFIPGRRVDHLRSGRAFYHELAENDSLTGLHNGRAFKDRYGRALEHAAVGHEPLSLILIDVDGLKAINDRLRSRCRQRGARPGLRGNETQQARGRHRRALGRR